MERTADRPWLPEEATTKWNVIYAGPYVLVPPSNDDAGTQRILVLVT
jgi:hypothetical protein